MFPEQIYQNEAAIVPEIKLEILGHTDLGEGVIRVQCTANGLPAKRLTQDIYGKPVNSIPVWSLDGTIVADWFALLLEAKYQSATAGQTMVIHNF